MINDELVSYFLPFQTKRNIWVHESTPHSRNIYRYTSFTNLLRILAGGLYMSPRIAFSDRREQGEYTSEYIKVCYKDTFDRNRNESYKKVREKFELSTHFNVSCWTMEEIESYPMWKAYKGEDITVRIKTDINSLLTSIEDNKINLYCGPMHYGEETNRVRMYDIMFKKTEEYSDEKEFRLYAIKNEYDLNSEPSPLTLNINPIEMIKEIYFSPFIHHDKISDLFNLLIATYPFIADRLNRSDLLEY